MIKRKWSDKYVNFLKIIFKFDHNFFLDFLYMYCPKKTSNYLYVCQYNQIPCLAYLFINTTLLSYTPSKYIINFMNIDFLIIKI